ncbi:MAG: hypothetical protein M3Z17_05955, partial [Gemmatimonadota bacterium]|nr:hypothetical protein [Gemmatimonadota bacterium]
MKPVFSVADSLEFLGPTEGPSRPRRLLIIDDDDMLRAATALLLRRSGYEVVEASHGAEALRLAEED